MFSRKVALTSVVSCCLALGAVAHDATAGDFSGFTTGQSIDGQFGWTTTDQWGNDAWGNTGPEFDEEVIDDGSGTIVWRVSNAVTTGGLSAQPFSPVAGAVAGETGAALWNDLGPDHTQPLSPPDPGAYATTRYFYGAFSFRSATGAPQADLAMSVSPSAKQVDGRMSYVSLVDDGVDGIDVSFYETGHTGDPWGSSSVEIASDLSYTDTHTIEIYMEFVDGLQDIGGDLYGNDIVKVYVNGTLAHTGSSWETYYYGTPPGGLTSADKHAVDSLTFALRGTAAPGNLGNGFYFVSADQANDPVPPTLTDGWHAFVIRENATEGPPLILANDNYAVDAVEIVTFASGQKAALATDAISGARISMINTLHVDRLDDVQNSDSLYGPYFNIWITDGAGNYAVAANEPSDAEWAGSRWDVPDWDFLKTKRCKIYETPGASGGEPGTSWVAAHTGKSSNLVFEDIADLTIEAPPVAYIQDPVNGVGSGAPDVLGTDEAFGFNWVFGDTLSNYISGTSEGFVVAGYEATANFAAHNVTQGTNYATIQGAIDDANDYDVIEVSTGVHNENLLIDRPLTLKNGSSPILDGGGSGVGIKIISSDVTVQGFEIRNYDIGILTDEPTAYQNVRILDNVVHDTDNGAHGFGIYIGYQAEAFHVPPVGTPLSDLLDFSGLEISGNTIYNNSGACLVLQSLKATTGTLNVVNNHIHDGDASAVWIDSAHDILVENNLLEACATGVFLSGFADDYYEGTPDAPFDPRNITVTCNTMQSNDGGIRVYDGWPAELYFNGNSILSNTSVGVFKYSSLSGASLDATDNWWGTIDGAVIATMVSGDVTYDPWLPGPPPCGDNILWLNVQPPSIYVQPSESVVIDMATLNLLQRVTGCQAVLNFDSTYFGTGGGDVNVVAGGGVWDELIYSVWDVGGDLDVAVGVDLETLGGTDADATVAVITLTPTGTEGVTQMVFRPDVSGVESTFFSDEAHQPVWPTKIDSQLIVIDGTDPAVEVTSPDGGEILQGGSGWTITWTASDVNIDSDSVEIEYFDGSTWQPIASGEDNDGSYLWDPVPLLDIDTAKVRVSVSDLAGNVGSDESDATFTIDSTDPTVDDIAASQGAGPDLTPSGTAVQGVVDIAVTTSDNLSGVAGAPTVTVTPNGGSAEPATFVSESPAGTFNYTWTLTSTTPNGQALITVSGLTDNAGNVAADATDTFEVDKNQATGTVSMDTFSAASYGFNRDVVFKATDGSGTVLKTWTVTVSFTNDTGTKVASGSYTLTEVPGATVGLSAKTGWSLRKKEAVVLDVDGQVSQDFFVTGGDLNDDNMVNILDYSILKANWNTTNPAGDINGDGGVQTFDYSLLKNGWFQAGDPE